MDSVIRACGVVLWCAVFVKCVALTHILYYVLIIL